MATAVIMPKLGLTMTEGTIVRWLAADGANVSKGEPILEILTDKANMEVEAPDSGMLCIKSPEGAIVPILEAIAWVLAPGEKLGEVQGGAAPAGQPAVATALEEAAQAPTGAVKVAAPGELAGGRLRISPAARRVARELGLALEALAQSSIAGTGPGGRIIQDDVRRFAAAQAVAVPAVSSLPSPGPSLEAKVIPLTGVRGLIAERMTRSVREAPQFTVSMEIAMDQLSGLRAELLPRLESLCGVRLSVTDMLVKAVARALTEFPLLNAFVSDREISLQPDVNIGVAVGVESGLVVPVIRNADARPLSESSIELKRLIERARRSSLTLDDLSGGTFTLSNLGMYGVSSFTAILNPPQAAILAVGGTREELRLTAKGIEARTVATFTLTSDHRAVDGLLASRFLARLKEIMEGPELRVVLQ